MPCLYFLANPEDEVNSLRADIKNMTAPSWLTGLPPNLGEPSHGKLKADQWHILGTVYLPVALVRLWHRSASPEIEYYIHIVFIILIESIARRTEYY
jgi:hypothetical protein